MSLFFCAAVAACCFSLFSVPLLRRWALARNLVDTPDARKVHSVPVPRLGGVALFFSFAGATVLFANFDPQLGGLLVGSLVLFVTGLIDDLYGLSPRAKFAGQIAAGALAMAVSGLYLQTLGNLFGFGVLSLPAWIGIPFTLFALVGVINALNLIDGLDGLAGGVAVIAFGAFFVLARQADCCSASLVALCMVGALLGFLRHNFHPATIFMGDTGSMLLGFLLGYLAIWLTQGQGMQLSPMTPVLVLALPLFDAVRVMGMRLLQGAGPFRPDRTHVHHLLLDFRFSHRETVLLLYAVSLCAAGLALFSRSWPVSQQLLLFLNGIALSRIAFCLLRLGRQEKNKVQGSRFKVQSST